MNIETLPIDAVHEYDRNPRTINDDAIDAVCRKSIKAFGFRQPIVIDADGVIIGGHTRYKAALKLGLKKVPVHVATDLTPEQIKAYRIADNKTADLADWDYELLPIELCGPQGDGLRPGPARLLEGRPGEDHSTRAVKDGLTDPDEVPEPPDEAMTQPGDLWILGDHRLLCGDSSKPEDVDRLLDGATIHLVNTDPPYNVKVEPRCNNAIAAGLSSFAGRRPIPTSTTSRAPTSPATPRRAKPTHKKLRAKDRPLANDFVSDEEFDRAARGLVRQHRPRAGSRRRVLHLGRLRQLRQLPAGAEGACELYFSPGDHLGSRSTRC